RKRGQCRVQQNVQCDRHWRASLYRIDESVQLASLSFVPREMQARLPVLVEEGQCLEIVQLSGQSAAEHFEKLLRRFGSALGEIQQVADGAICVLNHDRDVLEIVRNGL